MALANEPERLSMAGCARLLNIPWRRVRHLVKRRVFAPPTGHDTAGEPYWHRRDLYTWAAFDAELLNRVPLDHWPSPGIQAPYLGAETIENTVTALRWHTGVGPVWMLWHWDLDASTCKRELPSLAKHLPAAAAVTMVSVDYGVDGPALYGVLPGAPAQPVYEMPWSALSNVIGMPAPYWPSRLRRPDLMNGWRPGNAPVVAAADPDMDITSVLRLAVTLDEGSPARRTLVNLAQTWQHRATEAAESDLKILAEHTPAATVTVAATPLAVPAVEKDDLARDIQRAGWLELLDRTDDLALACVNQALQWDGGEDFPYNMRETIDPATERGAEWVARLVPARQSAAFELLRDRDREAVLFQDPLTDAPVVREEVRGQERYRTVVPYRLPTTSPLAELILEKPVWVRTEDGTLYPAPQFTPYGPKWGYQGSGPTILAALADLLLDDITATAPHNYDHQPPKGLEELARQKWPPGTVLTRAQLEAARKGRPIPETD